MVDDGPARPTSEGGGAAGDIVSSCFGELLLRAAGLFYLLACAGAFLTFEPLWIASSALLLFAGGVLFWVSRRQPQHRRSHIAIYVGLVLLAGAMVLFIGPP